MSSEWIDWCGGECPIAPYDTVTVELKGGDTQEDFANGFYWDHRNDPSDIRAYRLHTPPAGKLTAEEPRLHLSWAEDGEVVIEQNDVFILSIDPDGSFGYAIFESGRWLPGKIDMQPVPDLYAALLSERARRAGGAG